MSDPVKMALILGIAVGAVLALGAVAAWAAFLPAGQPTIDSACAPAGLRSYISERIHGAAYWRSQLGAGRKHVERLRARLPSDVGARLAAADAALAEARSLLPDYAAAKLQLETAFDILDRADIDVLIAAMWADDIAEWERCEPVVVARAGL